MEIQRVSRWDETPIEDNGNLKKRWIAISVGAFVFLSAILALIVAEYIKTPNANATVSTVVAVELEKTVFGMGSSSEFKLGESVAILTQRVKALETDNQRLNAELSELTDHDGVIDRMVAHIRALHGQSEATRRDVVDAMTAMMPESDPVFDMEGTDPTLQVEGAETPLLTKAKHTIVTPFQAPSAAEKPAPSAKTPSKTAQAEPDEGATN